MEQPTRALAGVAQVTSDLNEQQHRREDHQNVVAPLTSGVQEVDGGAGGNRQGERKPGGPSQHPSQAIQHYQGSESDQREWKPGLQCAAAEQPVARSRHVNLQIALHSGQESGIDVMSVIVLNQQLAILTIEGIRQSPPALGHQAPPDRCGGLVTPQRNTVQAPEDRRLRTPRAPRLPVRASSGRHCGRLVLGVRESLVPRKRHHDDQVVRNSGKSVRPPHAKRVWPVM